jgi:heme-degrading monooxygenase HmoA
MIIRSWSARATAAGADAYQKHFTTSVLPQLDQLDGFRGAYLLRRDLDDGVELQVLTRWTSLAAVERFAGADVELAVVEPEARAVLTSYDSRVRHQKILIDSVSARND